MTLIDQASSAQVALEPTIAVYRKSSRGIVCKVIPLHEGFVVPEGWQADPYAAGRTGDEPILQANSEDEPPAPKKARKVSE